MAEKVKLQGNNRKLEKRLMEENIKRLTSLFQSRNLFLDAAAVKEYQILTEGDDSELVMEVLRRSSQIILSKPSFEQIEHPDFRSWADMQKKCFGLNFDTLYYVSDKELPVLSTSLSDTTLSENDYQVVRYAVYFTKRKPGLIVDCATPGVMELYRKEMRKAYGRG